MAEALAGLRRRYEGRGVQLVPRRRRLGVPHRGRPRLPDEPRGGRDAQAQPRAAIETLAIVAYHQPVTRAEIEEIRGVSVSGGTLDQLIELGWVKIGRRRQTPGRPATFVVTQGFLDHFGLGSEKDLPGLAELRAAGLIDNDGGAGPLFGGAERAARKRRRPPTPDAVASGRASVVVRRRFSAMVSVTRPLPVRRPTFAPGGREACRGMGDRT